MCEAFRFLYHHPHRDLFLYDDPLPSTWYAGMDDLRFHDDASVSDSTSESKLPVSTWQRLVPNCGPGQVVVDGWKVLSVGPKEQWPTLRLDKSGRRLTIQLRTHQQGQPSYMRAGLYDLLWLRDDSPSDSNPRPDPDLATVMQFLASYLRQEPAQ
jgi:hypothetical protein